MTGLNKHSRIAVVIPCYKVSSLILEVLSQIPQEVERIYVVDDACPEGTGKHVARHCLDERVEVIVNSINLGVGGAVMRGYEAAIAAGMTIAVKLDGDAQMDPRQIMHFVDPIIGGDADYVKGNRFYDLSFLTGMPKFRLFGNAVLSFVTKLSSGYWNIFDPTNGFTAISIPVLRMLQFSKISPRYFFESDMLYHLSIIRAVVWDIPMNAKYNGEPSSLRISRVLLPFVKGNISNFFKRIFYNYFLRNFSLASLELALGTMLMLFGTIFGLHYWSISVESNLPATAGTVMVAALPIIVGFQMIMSFINYDISMTPSRPLSRLLKYVKNS